VDITFRAASTVAEITLDRQPVTFVRQRQISNITEYRSGRIDLVRIESGTAYQ
jgi:hypothetical protein